MIVLFQTLLLTSADELAEFQEAMNDPFFVADLREVMDDFQYAG